MKRAFLLVALALLAGALHAQPIVVFGKNESLELKAAVHHADPAKAAFAERVSALLASAAPFDVALRLGNPPEWGKTVAADTCGELHHRSRFEGGFVCHLSLDHLEAKHRYILCLNGNPKLKGNLLLPDPVPGLPEERFYDFLFVTTDAKGHYQSDLAVALTPGEYQLRLYVKDTADFKIVQYHDYFPFTVK